MVGSQQQCESDTTQRRGDGVEEVMVGESRMREEERVRQVFICCASVGATAGKQVLRRVAMGQQSLVRWDGRSDECCCGLRSPPDRWEGGPRGSLPLRPAQCPSFASWLHSAVIGRDCSPLPLATSSTYVL